MPPLPIRRVALYKHGVGHFEREGTVAGDAAVALTFKQREVSDVLKSLTVLDLDGGTVSAVSYDSVTPVEQLLAEIALSIPDSGSLVGLLPQLKGARVAVRPAGTVEPTIGVLLGLDAVTVRAAGGASTHPRLALLTDAGAVRTFDLFDADLSLLDDALRRDLDFYLRTQLAGKRKDARGFTLFAQGAGERRLRVSYVLEAPVWKATYRLLLNEPGDDAGRPLLQGWAVVDNQSDEDWDGVSLTLVAGLPVSFAHDLYTPRTVRRPVVAVEETAGVLPPEAEPAWRSGGGPLPAPPAAPRAALASPVRSRSVMAADDTTDFDALELGSAFGAPLSAASSVPMQVRERQVGDLFEYALDAPVTVRRNQSALVPIVLSRFDGRPVLLYQKAARAGNPLRCVELTNTTGLTLEGGPATVLDAGSYAGEAMLDTLTPGAERLVGYAVELAVRVTDALHSRSQPVTRVVVRGKTLEEHRSTERKTTYTFASTAAAEQTLFLDHPRGGDDWELVEPAAAHADTEGFRRFKLPVPPGSTRFVVRERLAGVTRYSLYDATDAQFGVWLEAKYFDKPTAKLLKQAFDLRRQAAAAEEQSQQREQEQARIGKEQGRIRDNLKALGTRASETELRERLVRTLGEQEDRLAELGREFHQLRADRDRLRGELSALVGSLEYAATIR